MLEHKRTQNVTTLVLCMYVYMYYVCKYVCMYVLRMYIGIIYILLLLQYTTSLNSIKQFLFVNEAKFVFFELQNESLYFILYGVQSGLSVITHSFSEYRLRSIYDRRRPHIHTYIHTYIHIWMQR